MWLALLTLGVGCLFFCYKELQRFDRPSRRLLAGSWAVLASLLIGLALFGGFKGRAEHLLGERTICTALSGPGYARYRSDAPASAARSRDPTSGPGLWQVPSEYLDPCDPPIQYIWLWRLNSTQLLLLLLFLPAMLLGAISCVAGLPERREEQAARLKTFAFLSAALLVSGLLFLSALLHWPAASLTEASANIYNAHASSFLLYWGVAYSALIAAFYIPIGARVAGGLDGGAAPNDLRPLEGLKTAAVIFAPVITALIGDIVKL
jgi:cytochrome bd-type quinol oxidase subunit 2